MSQIELLAYRENLLRTARHVDPKRLTHHGFKVYSQNDEDGIIEEIFRRIGPGSRTFVEFGVEDGSECNTVWLLMQGWSGLWLQGDEESCARIRETHKSYIDRWTLTLRNAFVTASNVNELIGNSFVGEIDLISIDIDGNDYWVWEALEVVRPRVVAIEYNATWHPPASIVVPYSTSQFWDGTNYFGASIAALNKLGTKKGYSLVGACMSGANAFFVRNDLLGDHFISPGDAAEHYEPARFFLADLKSGHKPRIGQVINI